MAAFLLSLRDDVVLEWREPDALRLRVPGRPVVMLAFRQVTGVFRDVFARLREGTHTEEALDAIALEAEGPAGLFKLRHFISKMEDARMLCRAVALDGRAAARLVPLSDRFTFSADGAAGTVRLSRFALLRRDGDRLVIESPLGFARLELHDPRVPAAVAALAQPCDGAAVAAAAGIGPDAGAALLTLLANAGALTAADQDGDVEDRTAALQQWEIHDLYFHSRSRLGRHAHPFGGVFRFEGRAPLLPAIKPPMHPNPIPLERPDVQQLMAADVPFTRVLEQRRSIRRHADAPIALRQLGEFLYRSVRVREVVTTEHGDLAFRIYPSGGALYETEFYLVVDRVDGLARGLYHYDPSGHTLEPVAGDTRAVAALLDAAFYTADRQSRPHVLIVLTARFQRMQWKYESMAYAAMLKHVGVVYQTMYLVATAMGLAPCALGGGHSDLFAEAAGLDYLAETSIGEFILGRPA